MKYQMLGKMTALLLLLGPVVGITGCSKQRSGDAETNSAVKFSETAESKLQRPMENQPESSYWFPADLLTWDFAKDPDAKYNVSHYPLTKRVAKKKLPKLNGTQNENMKVAALSIMNSSTSGNAPRGSNTFDANVFSYWQYIDQLVYWGGASGEGIIVPPSADVTDAAHKNGVPVLGTIFFPQTAHGGKIEWLDTFLQKDASGHFPIVDQLIAVADSYGFDGWFINQETDTAVTSFDEAKDGKQSPVENSQDGLRKEHADLMQELIQELKQKAQDKLEIMWYDSMTSDGKMDWQNALTDENKAYLVDAAMQPVADDMFLNFWWNTDKLADKKLLQSSQKKAAENQLDPYELYAGIDVQENGFATPVRWDLFADSQSVPYTSLGLYCPSWTYSSASDPDDFQTRENLFWVNSQGDPTKGTPPTGTQWPGISTYAVEQTALTELPFVTNFNLGNGYNYFIAGKKVSSRDWNNRSLQDILPTYRWIFEHAAGNTLTPSIDYADAFNGGNSLKLRGTMKKDQTSRMKMYRSQVKFSDKTVFTTTAKAQGKTQLDLVLSYEDGKQETFPADKKIGTDWTTVTYDVTKAAGKIVTSIDYNITADTDQEIYELRFGQIAALPTTKQKTPTAATDLKIENTTFDEEESNFAGVRLLWEPSNDQKNVHYELFQVNEDQTRSFLGATPAANYYLNALERQGEKNQTKFEVVTVSDTGLRSAPSESITLKWPDNSVPKAAFTVSNTLTAPGEKITFKNTSSANTDSVKWEFPGADQTTSTTDEPVVSYTKPGVYSVKLTAKNKKGQTPLEMTGLITITDQAKKLTILSDQAKVTASSFVNDAEAPAFAVDGSLESKWCATGNPPHTITLDLGSVQTVSEVHMSHAEAGGEGPDMNTKAYTIEVSEDGKTFTKVTRVINNTAGESHDTFAAQPARFVRITVDKPSQGSDSAVRIYEIAVAGLKEKLAE